jgi:hypothetical protein
MDTVMLVLAVLAVPAFVVGWHWFFYQQSGGRTWSPLWIAFSTTAAAALYLVAGTIGYTLDRHQRFIAHTAWTGGVIWSEIATGLGMALVAAYFWRKGLRSLRGRLTTQSTRALLHHQSPSWRPVASQIANDSVRAVREDV